MDTFTRIFLEIAAALYAYVYMTQFHRAFRYQVKPKLSTALILNSTPNSLLVHILLILFLRILKLTDYTQLR